MRILGITATYPPHHTGGYEISCQGVMEGLAARGHEVTVLTSQERLPGVADPPDERAVRRELVRYFRDHDLWAPGPVRSWKVERANQRAVASALAATQPDVAAVWHIGALSLGTVTAIAEAGVPLVYAVSDDWPSYCLKLDRWNTLLAPAGPLRGRLRHLVRVPTVVGDLGRTGTFCFISRECQDRAERYGTWTYPDSAIVHSGVDRSIFTPRADAPPWGWRLLYVGRLDRRKGIETLVRAMADLPRDTTLEVQGTGDEGERRRLQGVATQLGVAERVRFGSAPRDELPDRYRAADVCVFPSEWEEPFGLVPLEAMACGVPVAATGTGGSMEFLVDGRNCVRFEPGDPDALASAVRRLAADPNLRARVTGTGLTTAEYFDIDRLTDCLEAWYRHAADPAAHARPANRRFELDGGTRVRGVQREIGS